MVFKGVNVRESGENRKREESKIPSFHILHSLISIPSVLYQMLQMITIHPLNQSCGAAAKGNF